MSDMEVVNVSDDEIRENGNTTSLSAAEQISGPSNEDDINAINNVIVDQSEPSPDNNNGGGYNNEAVAIEPMEVGHETAIGNESLANVSPETTTTSTQIYTIPPSSNNIVQPVVEDGASSSTLVQTGVSLVTVSPVLKTNQKLNDSLNDFRDRKESNEKSKQSSTSIVDESECCPICFEPWSNSGAHRLASLNCGHLFGRSCIERWLHTKDHHKCPQCNAPAKKRHIRNIYAKTIQSIDTSERDNALAELEKEKLARKKAEESEAKALLASRIAQQECERIKKELELQRKLIAEQQWMTKPAPVGISSSQPASSQEHEISSSRNYVHQKVCQITQAGARVMAFNNDGVMVVSKPSPNNLFRGFGVLKVSTVGYKYTEFVAIHEKPIRDAVFSAQDNEFLLTASMDKTLKITSVRANGNVVSYTTPAPVWSCAWNTEDCNYVYGGLQNGQCYVFDMRNTSTHVQILKKDGAPGCPLVSLAYVPKDNSSVFKPGGLLTCSLKDCCFWENIDGTQYVPLPLHIPEGSCTCLRFEPTTRHCLVSQRPSEHCHNARHIVLQLNGTGMSSSLSRNQASGVGDVSDGSSLCSSEVIGTCFGGKSQKLLGHSALFTLPGDDSKLVVCAGDEATKSVVLWDATSSRKLQSLPHKDGTVIDVCAFNEKNRSYLATLTEQKLNFYCWQ